MFMKKYIPFLTTWIAPIVVLLGINVAFLSPAYLDGDILDQDDIKYGYAKSKELREYRETKGEEALWTNSMFSGMPTTQISTEYSGNIFEYISSVVRTTGGRTSSTYIIFYLMVAAFIGLRGMGVNHWLSTIGGFAYGYSGFFIIGYAAGHNAKVNTAAFIPLMILALLLVLEKKNWRAFILMSLFAGLSIHRNHFQITYYAALLMGIIWLTYFIKYARDKALLEFGKYTALLLLAGILAIGPNVANIWSTNVYTAESMRGGKSELTQKNQNQGEGGLSFDYAMGWSTGLYETVALVIPDAAGGGAKENYENKGLKTWDELTKGREPSKSAKEQYNSVMGSLMPWTTDSMGYGAYYVGASIFFLFCLAFFTVGGSIRQWVIASFAIFSFMAWGSNLEWFNRLLFDVLPLYNKFRVPSMAMVVLFFLVPFYGLLGLQHWFDMEKAERFKSLKRGVALFGGFIILFGLIAPFLMDLRTDNDQRIIDSLSQAGFNMNNISIDQLVSDRRGLITSSATMALFMGLLVGAALYLWHIGKVKQVVTVSIIGTVAITDLLTFNRDQLEKGDFMTEKDWNSQYSPTKADRKIINWGKKDKDPHYRVRNEMVGLTSAQTNSGNPSFSSYHHKTIGGYHGAKLQRYQDLIDYQLNRGAKACFNMLNTKYYIVNENIARPNPDACGNAWAVNRIKVVPDETTPTTTPCELDPELKGEIENWQKEVIQKRQRNEIPRGPNPNWPKLNKYFIDGNPVYAENLVPGTILYQNEYCTDLNRKVSLTGYFSEQELYVLDGRIVSGNADAEMAALRTFDPKTTAIVNPRDLEYFDGKNTFGTADVNLTSYDPKHLVYSFSGDDAFVVFSEIYYEGSGNDWQAYIDGEAVDHIRVNYLLRGLRVPAGKHEIEFKFAPKSYHVGNKINYAGSGILLLLLIWMGWKEYKEPRLED